MTKEDSKKVKDTEEKKEDKKAREASMEKEVKSEARGEEKGEKKDDKKAEEKTEVKHAPKAQKTQKKSYSQKRKKNVKRQIQRGCVYIKSSYNNTVVSFTDLHGNMLAWSSSGLLGFKGAKKATTYAATQVVADADEKVQKFGLRDLNVFVKGVGSGRDAALRAVAQRGYNLVMIKDTTPIPHNGCRPKKPRRV